MNVPDCIPSVLQTNERRSVVAGTSKIQSFFETTTASEVETSEGNPGNINGDAVDVAPPVPAPEEEAAAEPAATKPSPHGPIVQ